MRALSDGQSQFLKAARKSIDSAFFNCQLSFSFGESVDADRLVAAWQRLADVHEILRNPAWTHIDWKANPPADLGAEWQKLVERDANTPVGDDLSVHRLTLIRLPDASGHLLWSFHLLALDEAALVNVLSAWLAAYEDPALTLPAPGAEFENSLPSQPDLNEWVPVPLALFPLPQNPHPSDQRTWISESLDRSVKQDLIESAKAIDADPLDFIRGIFALLIANIRGKASVTTFELTPSHHTFSRTAGIAAVRSSISPTEPLNQLVREPPEGEQPIDVLLDIQPGSLNDRLHSLLPRWINSDANLSFRLPASLSLSYIHSDRPQIGICFDPGLYSTEGVHRLLQQFLSVLRQLIAAPSSPLAALHLSLPKEVTELTGSDPVHSFGSLLPQCIHTIFAQTAQDARDRIAIHGSKTYSYDSLNQLTNQIARALKKSGAVPKTRVAVEVDSSPFWLPVFLGIWRCGATVDLAPLEMSRSGPEGESFRAAIRITSSEPELALGSHSESLASLLKRASDERPRPFSVEVDPSAPAIIAEAGTFSHSLATALFQSAVTTAGIDPNSRFGITLPLDTLMPLAEAVGGLLSGATICLPPSDGWNTRTAFHEFVEANSLSSLSLPTSFWSDWMHYLAELSLQIPNSLQRVVIHGGRIASPPFQSWQQAANDVELVHIAFDDIPLAIHLSPDATLECPVSSRPMPGVSASLRGSLNDNPLPEGMPGVLEIHLDNHLIPIASDSSSREAQLVLSTDSFVRLDYKILAFAGDKRRPVPVALESAALDHPGIFECVAGISRSHVPSIWIVPRDTQKGEPIDFRDHLRTRIDGVVGIATIPRLPVDRAGRLDPEALPDPTTDPIRPTADAGSDAEEARLLSVFQRALGGRSIAAETPISDGASKPGIAEHLLEVAVASGFDAARITDFQRIFSTRSILREWRSRKASKSSTWSPLEAMRSSGSNPPIFLVHDSDGSIKGFADLVAELGSDQPCYAIAARAISDPDNAHESIDAMADAYAEAIHAFDSSLPVRIAGYGIGGLVAIETARRLIDLDHEAVLVAALATEPPPTTRGGIKRLFGLLGKSPATRKDPTPPGNLHELAKNHAFNRFPGTVHLFLPENGFVPIASAQNAWSSICDDPRFYHVPCHRDQLLEQPAAAAIANALNQLASNQDLSDEDLES